MRAILALAAVSLATVAFPLAVSAQPTEGTGADVAVAHGTAVACPDGQIPDIPGFQPSFCFLSPRNFLVAGASTLASGEAHGIVKEETLSRQTGLVVSEYRGRIFCVTVNGNKGVVGVVVEQSNSPSHPEGTVYYIPMLDNGPPGSAIPDLYGPRYLPGTPPADLQGQCTLDFAPLMTVVDGDVRVRDGQLSVG